MPACPRCGESIPAKSRACPQCGAKLRPKGSARLAAAVPITRPPLRSRWVYYLAGGGAVLGVALIAIYFFSIVPAVEAAREAARNSASKNNLKSLAFATHDHDERYGSFPPREDGQRSGKEVHGWHSYLLEFLDEEETYRRIDFDEPWNAPRNASAYQTTIAAFINPAVGETEDERGFTLGHYAVNAYLLPREQPLPWDRVDENGSSTGGYLADLRKQPLRITRVYDGTTNTLFSGEVIEGLRPWSDPENVRDLGEGLNRGPKSFGGPFPGGVNVAALDGWVYFLADDTSPEILRAIATPSGSEMMAFPDVQERFK